MKQEGEMLVKSIERKKSSDNNFKWDFGSTLVLHHQSDENIIYTLLKELSLISIIRQLEIIEWDY